MTRTPNGRPAAPVFGRARRTWIEPRVEKLAARETRNNIDPIVEDGDFSFGS